MRHFDGRIALKLDRKGEARRVFLDFFEQGVSSAFWLRISVRHNQFFKVFGCMEFQLWSSNVMHGKLVFWLIRKDKSSEIFGIEYIWVLKWFSS
ncbi:uncharacterized protein OCT59_001507 [Rhizophagus irregularis]|uniref:uncharacterized protein n=1 Tax=Rhizophagus irregularis TaxID=588596 RepID=UPI003317F7C1|nr:hypothetical protein OCT59_001507 [Rhizophagus irregularis]